MSNHSQPKNVPLIRIHENTGSDASIEEIESVRRRMSELAQALTQANSSIGQFGSAAAKLMEGQSKAITEVLGANTHMNKAIVAALKKWSAQAKLEVEQAMAEAHAMEKLDYH